LDASNQIVPVDAMMSAGRSHGAQSARLDPFQDRVGLHRCQFGGLPRGQLPTRLNHTASARPDHGFIGSVAESKSVLSSLDYQAIKS
jgi:hypothetical protein